MKENILILVNSFISCSKNQYFKTQLINTEHRAQNTDTEHRTQTHVKNVLYIFWEQQKILEVANIFGGQKKFRGQQKFCGGRGATKHFGE